eukprot:5943042-Karenia_brevis.AAC.1
MLSETRTRRAQQSSLVVLIQPNPGMPSFGRHWLTRISGMSNCIVQSCCSSLVCARLPTRWTTIQHSQHWTMSAPRRTLPDCSPVPFIQQAAEEAHAVNGPAAPDAVG